MLNNVISIEELKMAKEAKEIECYDFYDLPKFLFENEEYRKVSVLAKVIYALLYSQSRSLISVDLTEIKKEINTIKVNEKKISKALEELQEKKLIKCKTLQLINFQQSSSRLDQKMMVEMLEVELQ